MGAAERVGLTPTHRLGLVEERLADGARHVQPRGGGQGAGLGLQGAGAERAPRHPGKKKRPPATKVARRAQGSVASAGAP